MRTRYVYDRDLQAVVEIGNGSNREEPAKRLRPVGVIKDIEPYKALATDVATGKPPIITSRSHHREFLQRNGYAEVGNSHDAPRREELSQSDRISDIKRALGE